jgi:hypothetical protein
VVCVDRALIVFEMTVILEAAGDVSRVEKGGWAIWLGDCLEAAVDYERWKLPPLLSSGLGGRRLSVATPMSLTCTAVRASHNWNLFR